MPRTSQALPSEDKREARDTTGQEREAVHRPRSDGTLVFDAIVAPSGYFALPIAHRRGLFRLLDGKRLTVAEICQALELEPRPANALLAALTSLGLLELADGAYALTPPAEDYLLESSPTYMGFWLEFAGDHLSYSRVEQAVSSDVPQPRAGEFAAFEEKRQQARIFTRAMHGVSFAPALVWPELIDLSGHRLLLDVAGGSGAHSIGACLQWPELQAVVLDLPLVCDVAEEFVAHLGLGDRITTRRSDMWNDPFPAADLHFYSNILHELPPEKGRVLVEKSFQALEPRGRILLHEALFDDDKTGPFKIAAFNMAILMTSEGQQYSGCELSVILADAGFQDIQLIPAGGHYSILTGTKP